MVAKWSPSGCQVVAKWLILVAKWLPSGCQVFAKWLPIGRRLVSSYKLYFALLSQNISIFSLACHIFFQPPATTIQSSVDVTSPHLTSRPRVGFGIPNVIIYMVQHGCPTRHFHKLLARTLLTLKGDNNFCRTRPSQIINSSQSQEFSHVIFT